MVSFPLWETFARLLQDQTSARPTDASVPGEAHRHLCETSVRPLLFKLVVAEVLQRSRGGLAMSVCLPTGLGERFHKAFAQQLFSISGRSFFLLLSACRWRRSDTLSHSKTRKQTPKAKHPPTDAADRWPPASSKLGRFQTGRLQGMLHSQHRSSLPCV